MLGLQTTSNLTARRASNTRREVFFDYPMAKAPLMGLLSLVDDEEPLTDPEMGWNEERWVSPRDTTVLTEAAKGPFATSAAGGTAAANATHAVGDVVYLQLTSGDDIRVRDVLRVKDIELTDASKTDIVGYVTAIDHTSKVATMILQYVGTLATTAWSNSGATVNNGKYVTVIGTAAGEADNSRSDGRSTDPIKITNLTQTFRTVLGPWSRQALKMGQDFDSRPRYKKDVKLGTLRHMALMENAAFFGVKKDTTTTNHVGDTVPLRFMGGIRWYLEQWDIGNTINGGEFNYRLGGADLTSADYTLDSSEDKRVIKNIGAMTKDLWNEIIRRAFAQTSDNGFEKIAFCGDRFLSVLNKFCERNMIKMDEVDSKEEAYGMQIKRYNTIHGDLLFKTHPLFKENPAFQNTVVILDLADIIYHPFEDSDTGVYKNRQPNDADYRKDEIITECTLEIRRPRGHMWLDGITDII